MLTSKKLSKLFKSSKEITIDDNSKIIIMSDCHRGYGNIEDNFFNNKNLFIAALRHYYLKNYTYIELGDGDELWENKSFKQIIVTNKDVFAILSDYHQKKQFYMLYGNHDIIKKSNYIKNHVMKNYCDDISGKCVSVFPNLDIFEGLILTYRKTNNKILLVHGHQGDFLNDTIWKAARFLVRYLWRPLESIGVQNPTSAATNDRKKVYTEKELIKWSKKNNQMVIAGHTHRPTFPKVGDHLYFNDGCCINPGYITGIEITNGSISLIKWSIKTKNNRNLYVAKDVLAGPTKLTTFFNNKI